MSGVVLLSRPQMARLAPYFPSSRGKRHVDDRRVVTGIIYVIRNGLMWKDGPRGYGTPLPELRSLGRSFPLPLDAALRPYVDAPCTASTILPPSTTSWN
jgi:hypothetical protein